VRYAGSLLKYSFDEVDHRKGVYVVEMSADGSCTFDPVPLAPRRDVRRISGTLADVLRAPHEAAAREARSDFRYTTHRAIVNP